MFFIYILKSKKNHQLYVGYTENLQKRLAAHNNREVLSTKALIPWKIIFYEFYTNKNDALRREKYFKTTAGKRAVKLMLKETLEASNQ